MGDGESYGQKSDKTVPFPWDLGVQKEILEDKYDYELISTVP